MKTNYETQSLFDLFPEDKQEPFEIPKKDGYSCQWIEELQGFNINIANGKLFYSEHFFNKVLSDKTMEYFLQHKNIHWNQDKLLMYGKEVLLPRYSALYGSSNRTYTYSGLTLKPKQWNEKNELLFIKNEIEKTINQTNNEKIQFNAVLMNLYRNGKDYINWHTDAEKELGHNPLIASVSFGETRDFIIRKNDKSEKITIPLKNGTLLIMSGELQHFWQHCLPKRLKITQERISLTFRTIKDILIK